MHCFGAYAGCCASLIIDGRYCLFREKKNVRKGPRTDVLVEKLHYINCCTCFVRSRTEYVEESIAV